MSGLLMLAFTTAEAGDFAPFGLKIGYPLDKFATKKDIDSNEYFSVKPPKPFPPFFDEYFVRFNSTKQVKYVKSVGYLNNNKYTCYEIAAKLKEQFSKEYPDYKNATQSRYEPNLYSFSVEDGQNLYITNISCPFNKIVFEMYNSQLKPDFSNDPNFKKFELKL